jgi:hypothetical protein
MARGIVDLKHPNIVWAAVYGWLETSVSIAMAATSLPVPPLQLVAPTFHAAMAYMREDDGIHAMLFGPIGVHRPAA